MLAQLKRVRLSSRAKRLLEGSEYDFAAAALGGTSEAAAADDALLFITYPSRALLLTDIANLRDEQAIQWFWKRWQGKLAIEFKDDLLEIRNQLRSVWRRPDSSGSESILDEWLAWRPTETHLAVYEQFDVPWPKSLFRCSIKASKLVPAVQSLRAMLIQGVFEHWEHFKFCSNSSCSAPYFIAKRRDQTVCDAGDCKAAKQRQHALKWWNKNRAKKTFGKGK
jgi:hypothetical protein